MTRPLLAFAAGLATAGALYLGQAAGPPAAEPMPPPTPLAPSPKGPNPPATPGTVRATRVEVLDASGRVAIVLTSEAGVPTAIVSDNGQARKIDLARVARLAR